MVNQDLLNLAAELIARYDYYNTVAFGFIVNAVFNAFDDGRLNHVRYIDDVHKIISSEYI